MSSTKLCCVTSNDISLLGAQRALGRFSAARRGGREVCPRHSGRFSAARREGREVSAKIVRFFRTALHGAEVARVRILALWPTIFRGPRNFEPTHGIGVLPRNLTFFIRTAIFSQKMTSK